jgi:hypothetical protein
MTQNRHIPLVSTMAALVSILILASASFASSQTSAPAAAQATPPAPPAQSLQTCQTRDEIPADVRTAIEAAGQQTFDQATRGDIAGLRAGATNALQSSFGGVAAAVNDNRAALVGARQQLRAVYVLNTGATPSAEGRYVCGAFGASGLGAGTAQFNLPGLATGKYAVVIMDVTGPKGPFAMTAIFEDLGGWKLAGFYVRPEAANGHDGLWYLLRAREYKAKGQGHNAWFYYVTSWDLLAPVKFMDSNLLGKIIQESAGVQPPDVPLSGNTVNFSANGKTYKLTDVSVFSTESTLDISIKYSVPSAADFTATQADARTLATAFASQHPELKDAFTNIWAHAVDPSGVDVAATVSLKGPAKP